MEELFQIVAVDKSNASHVGTVFRSVYGEDFPLKYVYQPESLWQEIEEGRLASALAFDKVGKAVGYVALFKTAPSPRLWEAGNMVVDPAYKLTNVSSLLLNYYFNPNFNENGESDGIFGEAVCCHYFTQVSGNKAGMMDCALELNQLAGDSFKDNNHNKAETKRVSCVFSFLECTDPLEKVYLPEVYAEFLQRLSQPFRPRCFELGTAPLPDSGVTVWEEKYYPAAQTWKIAVRVIGADWPVIMEGFLSEAARRQVISLQLTLNTAYPQIGVAVQQLREQGFFLGGLVPRWFGTDGVLLQKVFGEEPDYEGTKLYSRTAKELLAFIRADWDEVGQLVKTGSNDK